MPKKKKWTRIAFTGLSIDEWKKELKQIEKKNKKPERRCYICKRIESKGSVAFLDDEESPISLAEKLKIEVYAIDLKDIVIEYQLCFECASLFRDVLSVYVEEDQELEFKFRIWAWRVKKELIKKIPEVKSKQIKEFLKENGATEAQIKKCFQYWKKEELIDKRYLR